MLLIIAVQVLSLHTFKYQWNLMKLMLLTRYPITLSIDGIQTSSDASTVHWTIEVSKNDLLSTASSSGNYYHLLLSLLLLLLL